MESDKARSEAASSSLRGSVGDLLRKAVAAGIGAVFLTEGSLRAYVREAKLPREVARYLIESAQTTKEQFVELLVREISGMVKRSDLPRAITAFLREHAIEFNATVRFRPHENEASEAAAEAIEASNDEAGAEPAPTPGADKLERAPNSTSESAPRPEPNEPPPSN